MIYRYAQQEGISVQAGPRPPRPDKRTEQADDLAGALLGNPEAPAAQIAAIFGVSGQRARAVRALLTDESEGEE